MLVSPIVSIFYASMLEINETEIEETRTRNQHFCSAALCIIETRGLETATKKNGFEIYWCHFRQSMIDDGKKIAKPMHDMNSIYIYILVDVVRILCESTKMRCEKFR